MFGFSIADWIFILLIIIIIIISVAISGMLDKK